MFKTMILAAAMSITAIPAFAAWDYCPVLYPYIEQLNIAGQGFDNIVTYRNVQNNDLVRLWYNKNLDMYLNVEQVTDSTGATVGVCLREVGGKLLAPPPTFTLFQKK